MLHFMGALVQIEKGTTKKIPNPAGGAFVKRQVCREIPPNQGLNLVLNRVGEPQYSREPENRKRR